MLYALVPYFGGHGNLPLFILCFLIIISMYGGGFATVPAYLKDMFGTRYVGAIHGWLITAWSAAGVLRSGAGQLHPAVPDRQRRSEGPGL